MLCLNLTKYVFFCVCFVQDDKIWMCNVPNRLIYEKLQFLTTVEWLIVRGFNFELNCVFSLCCSWCVHFVLLCVCVCFIWFVWMGRQFEIFFFSKKNVSWHHTRETPVRNWHQHPRNNSLWNMHFLVFFSCC